MLFLHKYERFKIIMIYHRACEINQVSPAIVATRAIINTRLMFNVLKYFIRSRYIIHDVNLKSVCLCALRSAVHTIKHCIAIRYRAIASECFEYKNECKIIIKIKLCT